MHSSQAKIRKALITAITTLNLAAIVDIFYRYKAEPESLKQLVNSVENGMSPLGHISQLLLAADDANIAKINIIVGLFILAGSNKFTRYELTAQGHIHEMFLDPQQVMICKYIIAKILENDIANNPHYNIHLLLPENFTHFFHFTIEMNLWLNVHETPVGIFETLVTSRHTINPEIIKRHCNQAIYTQQIEKIETPWAYAQGICTSYARER